VLFVSYDIHRRVAYSKITSIETLAQIVGEDEQKKPLFVLSFIFYLFTAPCLQKQRGVLSGNIYKTRKADTFNQMSVRLVPGFPTLIKLATDEERRHFPVHSQWELSHSRYVRHSPLKSWGLVSNLDRNPTRWRNGALASMTYSIAEHMQYTEERLESTILASKDAQQNVGSFLDGLKAQGFLERDDYE